MPARRYAEIAPEVQEICERYGIPYNKGPLVRQFGTVVRKIVRLAVPESRKSTADRVDDRVPAAA
ncbi:linoleoyl-CoA desaturase [Mycobacterium tuberculosis]|nr:linoleoyl-CoA desaturase [Mycobacterium tuberculosis]